MKNLDIIKIKRIILSWKIVLINHITDKEIICRKGKKVSKLNYREMKTT
jgi:hypothetical protein